MTASFPEPAQDFGGGTYPPLRPVLPQSHLELPGYLAAITPQGAPALGVLPPTIWPVFHPFPLPLTSPRMPWRGGWLRTRLGEIGVNSRAIHPNAQEMLAWMLGGPERPDGLPGWHPQEARIRHARTGLWVSGRAWPSRKDFQSAQPVGTPAVQEYERNGRLVRTVVTTSTVQSSVRQRGDRSLGRGVWAAALHDIAAAPLSEVSRILELSDHLGSKYGGKRLRGVERYRAQGRLLLAELGAWPWTQYDDGRLPSGWRADPPTITALHLWHSHACAEMEAETEKCRSALGNVDVPSDSAQ